MIDDNFVQRSMPYEFADMLMLDSSLSGVPIVRNNGIAVGMNGMFYTKDDKGI